MRVALRRPRVAPLPPQLNFHHLLTETGCQDQSVRFLETRMTKNLYVLTRVERHRLIRDRLGVQADGDRIRRLRRLLLPRGETIDAVAGLRSGNERE